MATPVNVSESVTPVAQRQHGGRLLGQGVYGCVFEPMPRCAGGKALRQVDGLPALVGLPVVGKITTEDVHDELSIGRKIMALPLAKNYFALPTASCEPALPITDPDVKSCKVVSEAEKGTTFTMLAMPAAGQQILKWGDNLQRLASQYERLFIHLLEGMIIYQKAGYVHNDIHMGNVLVDERGIARYIDFGLAFRLNDVKVWEDANLGRRFRPKYMWQAPEVHARRMVMNRVRLSEGVTQLREASSIYRQMEQNFPERKSLAMALEDFTTATRSVPDGEMVRTYGYAFDSWRLGLLMWLLWSDLMEGWSWFRKTAVWERRDDIRRVLSGMTEFDPRRRMSAREALRILDPHNRISDA